MLRGEPVAERRGAAHVGLCVGEAAGALRAPERAGERHPDGDGARAGDVAPGARQVAQVDHLGARDGRGATERGALGGVRDGGADLGGRDRLDRGAQQRHDAPARRGPERRGDELVELGRGDDRPRHAPVRDLALLRDLGGVVGHRHIVAPHHRHEHVVPHLRGALGGEQAPRAVDDRRAHVPQRRRGVARVDHDVDAVERRRETCARREVDGVLPRVPAQRPHLVAARGQPCHDVPTDGPRPTHHSDPHTRTTTRRPLM